MTSYLIDINVWLAMTWDLHPHHDRASRWYVSAGNSALLFCRFTTLGFLRLLTHDKVMGDSTATLSEALKLYDQWIADPRVDLAPEPRQTGKLFREALDPIALRPATKAIGDGYLIGFAVAAGARLVTFDKGLAGMARAQRAPVTLLQP